MWKWYVIGKMAPKIDKLACGEGQRCDKPQKIGTIK